MNSSELARFLAAARVIDDRILINEATVAVWADLLPEWVEMEVAIESLRHHYRTSDRRIMPVHVIEFAKTHRRALPPPPRINCDDCAGSGWNSALNDDGYRYAFYCDCEAGQTMKRNHR